MKRTRRKFTAKFKTQVVLEAIKERQTLSELAERFKLHPNQVTTWKKEFLNNAEEAFAKKSSKKDTTEKEIEELYQKIGILLRGHIQFAFFCRAKGSETWNKLKIPKALKAKKAVYPLNIFSTVAR